MSYIEQTLLCNRANYGEKRSLGEIKYIVIHYTGNDGDLAMNNAAYFKNNVLKPVASAHDFVDDERVVHSVPHDCVAYHCGGSTYYHDKCRNANSIGVEMCDTVKNGKYDLSDKTKENAMEYVARLMAQYNIPISNVVRHYDVTHKHCPEYLVDGQKWKEWKEELNSMKRYEYLADIPNEWGFRDIINNLMTCGVIAGDGSDPKGNGDKIDLSHDMVRLLIFEYRAGVYDNALKAAGITRV